MPVTDKYGRRDANVEHNANTLLWAMDNWMYTSEVDVDFRDERRRRVHRPARRCRAASGARHRTTPGRIYRNTNESALHVDLVPTHGTTRGNPTLLRTRGSYESLEGPNREANHVWPVRRRRRASTAATRPASSSRTARWPTSRRSARRPSIRGDRLPAELYGNVFVAEPAANLVSRLVVTDDGTTLQGAKAYEGAEFLASTDERFRPVYLSAAPDGTLYIVDMYRGDHPAQGLHHRVPARPDRRADLEAPDRLGRIYRVVHDGRRAAPSRRSSRATPAQLVATLVAPERLVARHGAAAAGRAPPGAPPCAPLRALARHVDGLARAAAGAVDARRHGRDRARAT